MKRKPVVPRIYIRLEVFVKGHKPLIISSPSKRRILAKLKHVVAKKYYLKVTYALGIYNDGDYTSKKDLLFAFHCFTDSDEVQFIREYNGIDVKGEK